MRLTESNRAADLRTLESLLSEAHRRLDDLGVPQASAIRDDLPRIVIVNTRTSPKPRQHVRDMQLSQIVSRTGPIHPVGEWAERAACKGQKMVYDQFPAVSHRPTKSDRLMEAHALATCRECPVLWDCREWSLQPVEPAVDHIAGGLTPRERHEIRARRERLRTRVQAARGWL